ncbi:MAG TPA: hypothetical protein QF353_02675 [Gammaproteobacteria bacterium]|nr:hypothetical protein [Gammaproteobacteria bacterium]
MPRQISGPGGLQLKNSTQYTLLRQKKIKEYQKKYHQDNFSHQGILSELFEELNNVYSSEIERIKTQYEIAQISAQVKSVQGEYLEKNHEMSQLERTLKDRNEQLNRQTKLLAQQNNKRKTPLIDLTNVFRSKAKVVDTELPRDIKHTRNLIQLNYQYMQAIPEERKTVKTKIEDKQHQISRLQEKGKQLKGANKNNTTQSLKSIEKKLGGMHQLHEMNEQVIHNQYEMDQLNQELAELNTQLQNIADWEKDLPIETQQLYNKLTQQHQDLAGKSPLEFSKQRTVEDIRNLSKAIAEIDREENSIDKIKSKLDKTKKQCNELKKAASSARQKNTLPFKDQIKLYQEVIKITDQGMTSYAKQLKDDQTRKQAEREKRSQYIEGLPSNPEEIAAYIKKMKR